MKMNSIKYAATLAVISVISVQQTTAQTAAPAETTEQTTSPLEAKYMNLTNSGHKTFNTRIPDIIDDIDALPKDTTGTIVMLGDSITQGFFSKDYMPKKIGGLIVVNEGISGDQIDRPDLNSGVTRRVGLVKEAKPAVVFVMIGINDFWGGKEKPAEVLPQYDKMFAMLREAVPDATIVLQSVLPTSKKNAYMNPYVDELNAHVKSLAEKAGPEVSYLDLHPVMEDAKGELKAAYTGDGVHLTEAAYMVWLKKLKETVPQVLGGTQK